MDDIPTFSYGGLRGCYSKDDATLGGNVDHGDPYTHAPSVWSYLVHRFAVRSVLDVGAGQGHAAAYFARVHLCDVIAVDGLASNLERAVFPLCIHDLRRAPFLTRVDLVHCAETVEHIEVDYVDHVISTLACGRVVCMTAAEPFQPGHHHVNCQPQSFWIGLMRERGYLYAEADTKRIRGLAEADNAIWFHNTGMVFIRS
jgi:SAM-dependent methyltransferase